MPKLSNKIASSNQRQRNLVWNKKSCVSFDPEIIWPALVFHLSLKWCCYGPETRLFYPQGFADGEHLNPRGILIVRVLDTDGGGGGGEFEGRSSLLSLQMKHCWYSLSAFLPLCSGVAPQIIQVTLWRSGAKARERSPPHCRGYKGAIFLYCVFGWSCENEMSHFALILYSRDRLQVKPLTAPQTRLVRFLPVILPAQRWGFLAWFSLWNVSSWFLL